MSLRILRREHENEDIGEVQEGSRLSSFFDIFSGLRQKRTTKTKLIEDEDDKYGDGYGLELSSIYGTKNPIAEQSKKEKASRPISSNLLDFRKEKHKKKITKREKQQNTDELENYEGEDDACGVQMSNFENPMARKVPADKKKQYMYNGDDANANAVEATATEEQEWERFYTNEGMPYLYNKATEETKWEEGDSTV